MAVIVMKEVHVHLVNAIAYVVNAKKTDNGRLAETNFQRDPLDSARAAQAMEFDIDHAMYKVDNPVLAYHVMQSFKPGEITPEEAHRIGVEFVEEITGGQYKYVIATHTDRQHIHNHIIICSTNEATHRKMRVIPSKRNGTLKQWRKISDDLCRKYDLSVQRGGLDLERHAPGMNELYANAKGASVKNDIRRIIDMTAGNAETFEEFQKQLRANGVSCTVRGRHLTYEYLDTGFKVRDNRLGQAFDQVNIMGKLNRAVMREITFNEKMIRKQFGGYVTVWLPGTERTQTLTIDESQIIRNGKTCRAFLSMDQQQVITDRDDRYVRTIRTDQLYEHFARPDIDLSGLAERTFRPEIGVSEAQRRYYHMQGKRLDTLRDRTRELNAARQWIVRNADGNFAQGVHKLEFEVRKERAEFQAIIVSRNDLADDINGQGRSNIEPDADMKRREKRLTELELDLKALKRVEQREHGSQPDREQNHRRSASR